MFASSILSAAASLLAVLTPEAPAVVQAAVPETPDPEYEACVAAVEADVADGRAKAERWASEGGGPPAQHCLAVADLAAGFPKLAAIRLEELAERFDAGDNMIRARLLSQATIAWLEADEVEQAETAITKAFALAPNAGGLHLAAASVYAAQDLQQATIDAVTEAEEAGVASAEGYVLRGRAHFALAQYEEAAKDVVNALKIDPFNLDALVLRGDLAKTGIVIETNYQRAPTEAGQ